MTAQLYLLNLWAAILGRPLITQDDHDAIAALYLKRIIAYEDQLAGFEAERDRVCDDYLAVATRAEAERKAAAINCGKTNAAYADRIKRLKQSLHQLADEA